MKWADKRDAVTCGFATLLRSIYKLDGVTPGLSNLSLESEVTSNNPIITLHRLCPVSCVIETMHIFLD